MSHGICEEGFYAEALAGPVSTNERLWTSDEEAKLVALVRDLCVLGQTHATLWQAAEDSKELPSRKARAIYTHFLSFMITIQAFSLRSSACPGPFLAAATIKGKGTT